MVFLRIVLALLISVTIVLSFCGCINSEPANNENPVPEPVLPEESLPEENGEWKNFIEEISAEGISPEETEKLLELGYEQEEIMEMEIPKIKRALLAAELGISKETLALADYLVENPEIANDDKQFISFGLYKTVRTEYVEDFLTAVKKCEPCKIAGILTGYTMPFFFEISYEPGGAIEIINIWRENIRFAEMTEVYETKSFWYFTDGNGNDFSILKSATGDRIIDENYVPGSDIPGMPVTAEEAAAEAEKLFVISLAGEDESENDNSLRLYSSWGFAVREEDYKNGKAIMESECEFVVDSSFTIDEKPYYCVSIYCEGNDIGRVYCIGAEDIRSAYSIGMANGETVPIEYIGKPEIAIEKQ